MYSDGNRIVQQVGSPTAGGAHADYCIVNDDGDEIERIKFQHDTIPAVGVVGATNECLLAIVKDRLVAFQNGGFGCVENGVAIDCIQAALNVLEYRTHLRQQRGVEGSHAK